jgi:hypothetical protein
MPNVTNDRHRDNRDLTRTEDGRNVDAFVSGDESPPSTSVSDQAWSTLSRSSLIEHQREAPDHRDGDERRSRHEAT